VKTGFTKFDTLSLAQIFNLPYRRIEFCEAGKPTLPSFENLAD